MDVNEMHISLQLLVLRYIFKSNYNVDTLFVMPHMTHTGMPQECVVMLLGYGMITVARTSYIPRNIGICFRNVLLGRKTYKMTILVILDIITFWWIKIKFIRLNDFKISFRIKLGEKNWMVKSGTVRYWFPTKSFSSLFMCGDGDGVVRMWHVSEGMFTG